MTDFLRRVADLPVLGLGVSTEYGAADAPGALDLRRLRREHPEFARFLEVGVETCKGSSAPSRTKAALAMRAPAGSPSTSGTG